MLSDVSEFENYENLRTGSYVFSHKQYSGSTKLYMNGRDIDLVINLFRTRSITTRSLILKQAIMAQHSAEANAKAKSVFLAFSCDSTAIVSNKLELKPLIHFLF